MYRPFQFHKRSQFFIRTNDEKIVRPSESKADTQPLTPKRTKQISTTPFLLWHFSPGDKIENGSAQSPPNRDPIRMWLNQAPVITVTGKAFFDVGHSFKDQKSNRRSHLPDYAAWEIHPVMALRVVQAHARVLAIKFL